MYSERRKRGQSGDHSIFGDAAVSCVGAGAPSGGAGSAGGGAGSSGGGAGSSGGGAGSSGGGSSARAIGARTESASAQAATTAAIRRARPAGNLSRDPVTSPAPKDEGNDRWGPA